LDDLANRIDHPDLGACADDMLVLKNIGSRGESGMPEAGYWPIPKTPARQGQGHAEDL
jgi:dihydroxy-acid dehydratase